MRKIVVAIDGLSACGKSVTARQVARILGYRHIDSGAMYRAVTLYLVRRRIAIEEDAEGVAKAMADIGISFRHHARKGATEVYLNGKNVEEAIRRPQISERVSRVSALPVVRTALVDLQRALGKNKGVVMDGRDIGATVFPKAELKVFMTADLATRSQRRQLELKKKGNVIPLHTMSEQLRRRDRQDSVRAISPLRKADDAVVVDTTYRTLDEQVDEVVQLALARIIQTEQSGGAK